MGLVSDILWCHMGNQWSVSYRKILYVRPMCLIFGVWYQPDDARRHAIWTHVLSPNRDQIITWADDKLSLSFDESIGKTLTYRDLLDKQIRLCLFSVNIFLGYSITFKVVHLISCIHDHLEPFRYVLFCHIFVGYPSVTTLLLTAW